MWMRAPDVLPGRVREEETEVDVHDGAVCCEQNVAVVPVLDLQQVGHHGPRSARARKGMRRAPVLLRRARTVQVGEEPNESRVRRVATL